MGTTVSSRLKELRGYFKALSGSGRLRILVELAADGELSVSALARALRMSQPLVSWHLRGLRKAGLVKVMRRGRETICALNREVLDAYQHEFVELLHSTS